MPRGFKSIVQTLLLDGLVVEWRRGRRGVDRLRVRATGKRKRDHQRSETENFLHINSSCGRIFVQVHGPVFVLVKLDLAISFGHEDLVRLDSLRLYL